MFLYALHLAIQINLESAFYHSYIVLLPIMAVNHSGMNVKIRVMT